MKTVIHVWTQTAINRPQTETANFWGIGDLIRGSVSLAEVCHQQGYHFVLDMRGHPIGRAFAPQLDTPERVDYSQIEFHAFKTHQDLAAFLAAAFTASDCVMLNTNGYREWPEHISAHTKATLQKHLRPSPQLAALLADRLPKSERYSIVHFRLGDDTMKGNSRAKMIRAMTLLARNRENGDILMSDSARFKALASEFLGVKSTPTAPVHTGLADNDDRLLDTIAEFFIVARAQRIKTYSVYSWVSGFVMSAALIFDVPVQRITLRRTARYYLECVRTALLSYLRSSVTIRRSRT